MLTSKVVQASIASILDLIAKSEVDEAKKRIQVLVPDVRTEKDRGSLLAAAGIVASISKGKEGTMQTWDSAKVDRAAHSISKSQMADDFDLGYAEALTVYSRLTASTPQSAV